MFVVFEGIDGSGKTTVSNRVAAELRARGIAVDHIREGGEFASSLVTRLREFGKDPRNMAMRPMSELLFYAAREAQLLAECVEPALGGGGLVFADRYLYSYEVLAHHGRGVDVERVRPILDAVADGRWPDLVVLLDVDPHIARSRRRASKIARKGEHSSSSGGSRKGLGGVGVRHRLREGYLELAAADPKRWLVVDNTGSALEDVVAAVSHAITELYEGSPAAKVIASTEIAAAEPIEAASGALEDGRRAFFRVIAGRAESEPAVAAYLLSGLDDDESYAWRERLLPDAPEVVAYGLRGLSDERAWQLREELLDRVPFHVARSLDGTAVEGPEARAMRDRLVESQPRAVLASIDGNDDDHAWRLREALWDRQPARVVSSLKRLDSPRAWELRDAWKSMNMRQGEIEPAAAAPLASSLRGLDHEKSWKLRRQLFETAPSQVLASLADTTSDESWAWRERHAKLAPKIVMRTFDGVDSPRAWELRREHAPKVKEALDSMTGLDVDTGWAIREALAPVWPSTVVKSLGELGAGARGAKLAREVLSAHRGNVSLLKHITAIVNRRPRRSAARGAG